MTPQPRSPIATRLRVTLLLLLLVGVAAGSLLLLSRVKLEDDRDDDAPATPQSTMLPSAARPPSPPPTIPPAPPKLPKPQAPIRHLITYHQAGAFDPVREHTAVIDLDAGTIESMGGKPVRLSEGEMKDVLGETAAACFTNGEPNRDACTDISWRMTIIADGCALYLHGSCPSDNASVHNLQGTIPVLGHWWPQR